MIWIVGNKGMLGSELSLAAQAAGLPHVGSDREVNILDTASLRDFVRLHSPDWIVNCAAYTSVDKAEDEPEICRRLNVEGPANLGRVAAETGASILHLSTDYVFSGDASEAYREEDAIGPTGVYGHTKAEGEAALRATCPSAVILRTAWLYGKFGPNFVYTMLRLMRQKERIGVVADQRGSPTWTRDLVKAILAIILSPQHRYGIYHYTGKGETTWWEFAQAIRDEGLKTGLLTRPCEIRALTTAEYPTKARRPAYSVLSKEKIARDYGIVPPDWSTSLADFVRELSRDPEALRIGNLQ
ncbi:MAG: dTDP-4-dehydrorhamnose reductase [Rectinemataceae bacterium]|nr:dTDP-4-dehydrorhamnose reductase [Rectinemataceae bacterium]